MKAMGLLKKWFLITSMTVNGAVPQISFAEGGDSSGGGQSIRHGAQFHLRDLDDGVNCRWYAGRDFALLSPHLEKILATVEQGDVEFADQLRARIYDIKWCLSRKALDELPAKIQNGVTKRANNAEQAGIRTSSRAYIDENKFMGMSPQHKAYFVVHEALHDFVKEEGLGKISNLRDFVAWLKQFESDPNAMNSKTMHEQMAFAGIDPRFYPVPLDYKMGLVEARLLFWTNQKSSRMVVRLLKASAKAPGVDLYFDRFAQERIPLDWSPGGLHQERAIDTVYSPQSSPDDSLREIAQHLLASPRVYSSTKTRIAMAAVAYRDQETVELAIKSDVSLKFLGRNGRDILAVAMNDFSGKSVENLLRLGIDANSIFNMGTTPLMIAASMANPAAVKLLLAHGANARVKNDLGFDPLVIYLRGNTYDEGCGEIADQLIQAGCYSAQDFGRAVQRVYQSTFKSGPSTACRNQLNERIAKKIDCRK